MTDLPTTVPASEEDKWPLFRGNPQATGVAGSGLPDELELLWTFSTKKGGFESTAAIDGGMVYAGCLDGNLYAIDLKSGEKRWEFTTDLGFTASAAVRNGLLYIGDYDGRFYCFDAASGKPKWDLQTDAEINSSANFYQDNVLFGSQDGNLYCLKADTGELVFKYQSDDMIQCSPTVVGDRAFVAGCDGRLHVVDLVAGKSVASIDIEAPTLCTPAVLGRLAVMGTTGNALLAVDWQAGKIAWRYENAGTCGRVSLVGRADAQCGDRRLARQTGPCRRHQDRPAALDLRHQTLGRQLAGHRRRSRAGRFERRATLCPGCGVGQAGLAVRGRRRDRRLACRGRGTLGHRHRRREPVLFRR